MKITEFCKDAVGAMVLFIGLAVSISSFAGEWIADTDTGCQVWNPEPSPNESIKWSGACSNNIATGNGTVQWYLNGKPSLRHEGNFREGKLNGKGVITDVNENRIEGDFVNGKRTGKGIIKWHNGDRYEGDFVDGKLAGKGVFIAISGDRYEGSWVDSRQEGYGELKLKSGRVDRGIWAAGKLKQPCTSNDACADMKSKSDPEFAKQYAIEPYKKDVEAVESAGAANREAAYSEKRQNAEQCEKNWAACFGRCLFSMDYNTRLHCQSGCARCAN